MTAKKKATNLVKHYFQQVVPPDYIYNNKTFTLYEQIAKNYAIIGIINEGNPDLELINAIKDL